MKLEFISLIANSEVALGYSRLCCLKSHLVACQPPLVAKHESSTYWGTGNIKIHVAANVDVFPFVPRLNFSTLFPKEKRKISYLCKGTPVGSNSILLLTLTQCNSSWRQCVHPSRATWHVNLVRVHLYKILSQLQWILCKWAVKCGVVPHEAFLDCFLKSSCTEMGSDKTISSSPTDTMVLEVWYVQGRNGNCTSLQVCHQKPIIVDLLACPKQTTFACPRQTIFRQS